MNPVAVDLLNNEEKRNRAQQVATLQLLNQAQATPSGQPNLLERVVNRLGVRRIRTGQRLKERTPAPGHDLTPR